MLTQILLCISRYILSKSNPCQCPCVYFADQKRRYPANNVSMLPKVTCATDASQSPQSPCRHLSVRQSYWFLYSGNSTGVRPLSSVTGLFSMTITNVSNGHRQMSPGFHLSTLNRPPGLLRFFCSTGNWQLPSIVRFCLWRNRKNFKAVAGSVSLFWCCKQPLPDKYKWVWVDTSVSSGSFVSSDRCSF